MSFMGKNQQDEDDDSMSEETEQNFSLKNIRDVLSASDPLPKGYIEDLDISQEPPADKTFRKILVTVGTTSFDALIDTIIGQKTLAQFRDWGTRNVRVQIGESRAMKPGDDFISSIHFHFYKYKSSLKEDMEWADLIIGHAGAGTALEALELNKTLLVVPNEELMDNHQVELSQFLSQNNYAFHSTLANFNLATRLIRNDTLVPLPQKVPHAFENFLIDTLNMDKERVVQIIQAEDSGSSHRRDEREAFENIRSRLYNSF